MRSKVLFASCAVAALAVVPTAAFASDAHVSSPSVAKPGEVKLTSALLPGLAKLRTAGVPAAATRLQVEVSLAQTSAAAKAEQRAVAGMYTKGSANYHHFLTPKTFDAKFAVSPATVKRISSVLTAHGLQVAYAAPNGGLLTLSGNLGEVAKTFDVTFKKFLAPNGYGFWANTAAPTVPSGVSVVTGLNSIPAASLDDTTPTQTNPAQTLCLPTAVVSSGLCVGAVSAPALWSTYDMPSTNTGTGQKIAVIGAGDFKTPASDLRTFEAEYGLPQVNIVEHPVADLQTYTSGEGEWAMDSEASTGMAPGVRELDYYFADALGDADAFEAWVNDANGPLQANYSVGGCEILDSALGTIAQDDPILEQAVAEGRTMFASTGDTGGSCTAVTGNGFLNTGAPQAEYPATSPYVVGVGGTTLYTTGTAAPTRVVENGWTHSGGGTSTVEPAPKWQDGLGSIVKPGVCALSSSLSTSVLGDSCKGVPDVAAMSGDITVLTEAVGRAEAGNGYQDVEGGLDGADGGTSLASPLWVGMWARIQAAAPAADGAFAGLGFAAPSLYNVAYNTTEDDADFYNVAIGTNGQWHDNARSSLDPTGWSYVSGLGVPNVAPLMKTLTGSTTPANTSVAAPTGSITVVDTTS